MTTKTVFCIMALLCLVATAAAVQPASVVTVFHIRNGNVNTVSTTIVYGGSPNYFLDYGEYIVTTTDAGGAYQKQAWIEDPRVKRLLDFSEGDPSAVVRDDVDFTVVLPYRGDTAKVLVYDKDKKLLAEADLGGAKNAFCMAHPADERCRSTVAVWAAGILLVLVVLGAGAYVLLKRKKAGGNT
jgi:hypothetical protein